MRSMARLALSDRGDRMNRREFGALIGSAAVTTAWQRVAHAQGRSRLPIIGILGSRTPSVAAQWTAAFENRLRDLGWVVGSTVAIEYRWAEGRSERLAEIASEFVRLKVDVIVTSGARNVAAAKQTTSVIPIVFVAGDPIGYGFVESLARPGGNLTGLSVQSIDLAAKRIEFLWEATPRLSRVAVMVNPGNPISGLEMVEVQSAARALGIEVVPLEIQGRDDIAPGFDAVRGRVQALRILNDRLTFENRALINGLALASRLPTMHGLRAGVESGGLMSYGPNFRDMMRRTADYVDRILRGAKPADLAVQQPTKLDLTINLKTAKAIDLEMPSRLLVLADELIK